MAVRNDAARITLGEFLAKIRSELIPVTDRFVYFAASSPLNEEDLRDYIEDPLAALPRAVRDLLPPVAILLVPYLERANGKDRPGGAKERKENEDWVVFDRPPDGKALRSVQLSAKSGEAVIALPVDDLEVADAHYEFYHQIAWLVSELASADLLASYSSLIREELANRMHGEVDEESWQLKQALLRRQSKVRDSKAFREYAKASFVDTLTLYLHGICCDIDVETGPRQLPSRYLRKRLQMLHGVFPPPKGYAVFPEDLDTNPVAS